jgi:hypothetical protein
MAAAQADLLPVDVIAFPGWTAADAELQGYTTTRTYNHHLRYGGAKITLEDPANVQRLRSLRLLAVIGQC